MATLTGPQAEWKVVLSADGAVDTHTFSKQGIFVSSEVNCGIHRKVNGTITSPPIYKLLKAGPSPNKLCTGTLGWLTLTRLYLKNNQTEIYDTYVKAMKQRKQMKTWNQTPDKQEGSDQQRAAFEDLSFQELTKFDHTQLVMTFYTQPAEACAQQQTGGIER